MSTSSGDDDFSSAASLSAGEVSDGCDCDDCFLGISDMMSSALRTVPVRKVSDRLTVLTGYIYYI